MKLHLALLTTWIALANTGYPQELGFHYPQEPGFQSDFFAASFSRYTPSFTRLSVDSLGQGKLELNPVMPAEVPVSSYHSPLQLEADTPSHFVYAVQSLTRGSQPQAVWSISCEPQALTLRTDFVNEKTSVPFVLNFNQRLNAATLLGLMELGERRVSLPCVLHLPDLGSVRITCGVPGVKLDYDARRLVEPRYVRVEFPAATAAQPSIEFRLEVAAIYPSIPGIEKNPLYDGYRRDYLNAIQLVARTQMIAANASTDNCMFDLFIYSDWALRAPPLVGNLTCLDLLRQTLDRYLAGVPGYGIVGYGLIHDGLSDIGGWKAPWNSLDCAPSLVIASTNYVAGTNDLDWARTHYDQIAIWARQMMAADREGDGLIEYPASGNLGDRPTANRRPSNWWDTINFGYKDAYSNALAYRACNQLSQLAHRIGRERDAHFFAEKAAKLKAAYVPNFLNPATGVIAGWKSADGQLHDYYFTYLQSIAITAGLLDTPTANSVMDKLLAKMKEVGYTDFRLGLPGNLIPIKKGDYVDHDTDDLPSKFGEPRLEDGSDGFQYYQNGGSTPRFAYYTIKALFQLGRVEDARRILRPMLASYSAGEFQGFDANGMSRDWHDWKGGCHGYEGMVAPAYVTLMAALDDPR
jgi:hypothetical protein